MTRAVLAFVVIGLAAGLAPCAPAHVAAQAAPSTADASLLAAVEAALAAASDVPADSIAVSVLSGVVTVSGSVDCEECGGTSTPPGAATVQQSLGAVIRAVPGVERVEFRLRYQPD